MKQTTKQSKSKIDCKKQPKVVKSLNRIRDDLAVSVKTRKAFVASSWFEEFTSTRKKMPLIVVNTDNSDFAVLKLKDFVKLIKQK